MNYPGYISDSQPALLDQPPEKVAHTLRSKGIRVFYFITDPSTGKVSTSHECLQSIAQSLEDHLLSFDGHEGIFCQVSDYVDVIYGVFVHRTLRGQGQGGTRFWDYQTLADFLRDGLRLSQAMTHKNALAGLWWGGGKGVITRPVELSRTDHPLRRKLFAEYGRFISSLRGCYIAAEDVGTTTDDMSAIFSETRFATCIPHTKGGSGNPSNMTALGVIRGMEAGLDFISGHHRNGQTPSYRKSPLRGKHIVVQGVGHVGKEIISLALKSGARVTATDINVGRLDQLRDIWHGQPVELVCTQPDDLTPFDIQCDVLCPAATGGILNPSSIPHIKASLICGAANNQLENPDRDGALLSERRVLYLPDFLVNRMGIVKCANEQYGSVTHDLMQHLDYTWEHSVYQTSLRVLSHAQNTLKHPHTAAVHLAEDRSRIMHPIWGHRGQKIIHSISDPANFES